MKALDLVNQVMSRIERDPFTHMTYGQLELLKNLLEQEANTPAGRASKVKHLRSVAGAIRREITNTQKQVEDLKAQLKPIVIEIRELEGKGST
jgi:hypothetical protein